MTDLLSRNDHLSRSDRLTHIDGATPVVNQSPVVIPEQTPPKVAQSAPTPERPVPSTALQQPFDATLHDAVELPVGVEGLRRLGKDRHYMHHNRLAVLVALTNLFILGYGIFGAGWFSTAGVALVPLANLAIANLSMGILIRQHHVVNLLFKVATAAPTSWPLRVRWTLGKVYHFGGIHIGGTVSGSVWFAVFMGAIVFNASTGVGGVSTLLLALTGALAGLLLAIIGFSLPRYRAKYHDRFEQMHRFGGWTALALFWAHLIVFTADQTTGSLAMALRSSVGYWLLALVTLSIGLPWVRLKKVPVHIERPSNHVALARFDYGVTPFAGSSTAISRSPLKEWHSFANVPSPDTTGFRLTISRAGDWTGSFIDDVPSHVWVKAIPTAGVGNIDKLFKKVVWVATGSGIGPTLPHLLSQEVPAHLIWATRDPRKTYGDGLVEEILDVQPHATIWDTDKNGKPDMVKLAYQAVQAFDAEAVICISNKKLTWQVVEGMERIGVPAYGAIWDS